MAHGENLIFIPRLNGMEFSLVCVSDDGERRFEWIEIGFAKRFSLAYF
jgi:hypothetical protein